MIYLNRADIKKITEVLEKFPDLDLFEIDQNSSSGIGSITTMKFDIKVGEVNGSFQVEISGVDEW